MTKILLENAIVAACLCNQLESRKSPNITTHSFTPFSQPRCYQQEIDYSKNANKNPQTCLRRSETLKQHQQPKPATEPRQQRVTVRLQSNLALPAKSSTTGFTIPLICCCGQRRSASYQSGSEQDPAVLSPGERGVYCEGEFHDAGGEAAFGGGGGVVGASE